MMEHTLTDLSPDLRLAVNLIEQGQWDRAWSMFYKYEQANPGGALVRSFMGLLKAVKEGQPYPGIELCKEAIKLDGREPLAYLNLCKCYLAAGDRYQAIRAIQRGLKIPSNHKPLLVKYYRAMGVRRKPVLGFLHRDNPFNILLGKVTWKMGYAGVSKKEMQRKG